MEYISQLKKDAVIGGEDWNQTKFTWTVTPRFYLPGVTFWLQFLLKLSPGEYLNGKHFVLHLRTLAYNIIQVPGSMQQAMLSRCEQYRQENDVMIPTSLFTSQSFK